MNLARCIALALVLAPFAAGDAYAGEPAAGEATAASSSSSTSNLGQAFLDARRNSKKAPRSADGARGNSFSLSGCMTDPSKCTCQSEDAKESSACGDVLGYFCRESTQKSLAASCMDLFGGAMVCKCATAQQITSHIKADEAAAKKKKKKSTKKKSTKKK